MKEYGGLSLCWQNVQSSGKSCVSSTGDNLQKHKWTEKDVTGFCEGRELSKEESEEVSSMD